MNIWDIVNSSVIFSLSNVPFRFGRIAYLFCVQDFSTGANDLTEALHILASFLRRIAFRQQLLYTLVDDAVLQDAQLEKLTDELDIAEHLLLDDIFELLFIEQLMVDAVCATILSCFI